MARILTKGRIWNALSEKAKEAIKQEGDTVEFTDEEKKDVRNESQREEPKKP